MSDHKETDSKKMLSKDDIDLWREVTKDIEPMEGRGYIEPSDVLEKAKQDEAKPIKNIKKTSEPAQKSKFPQGKDIDRSTEKKLRRGEMAVEGKLDLHGMNQGEARQALVSFIRGAEAAGKRCVLVVTGKGNTGRTSEDWLDREPGVLKRKVPEWLHEVELNSIVLQTVPAQPKHGGDGALYVYLRRRRS